jgi:hypothetical protein
MVVFRLESFTFTETCRHGFITVMVYLCIKLTTRLAVKSPNSLHAIEALYGKLASEAQKANTHSKPISAVGVDELVYNPEWCGKTP